MVHPLCPSGTEIFPGNGHCYRLVAEKAPWLQAQEHCQTWAGAALAMVDSPAIQHFLVSKVTRYTYSGKGRVDGGCSAFRVWAEPEACRGSGGKIGKLGLCVLPHRWPFLAALCM